jgi:hypothetical protein
MARESHVFTAGFSPDPDFDFELRCVLGQAFAGGADVGEVLAAVEGVKKGDHEAWAGAWSTLAERVAGIAARSAAAGDDVSAASAYLRASQYSGVAVNALSALGAADRLLPAFRAQQEAWERFTELVDCEVTRLDIPYESSSLPAWLFRSGGSGHAHPLLVCVNGSDGSLAALWGSAISGGLRRGYDVLVFDGPGQQSMLFEHGTAFRPDWEAVVTPVLDAVLTDDRVDPARLALYGVSQAGYWVPRVLAFEHRFAAAIADPGVVDVSTSWTAHLPKSLLALLEKGDDEKFDREMALGLRLSHTSARQWGFRARPYGGLGYAATVRAVQAYRIDEEIAARIATPLFISSPEGEQFWPGQSERLAELVGERATLVPFTAAEGASLHCQPLARGLTEQRMFDWLGERLGV